MCGSGKSFVLIYLSRPIELDDPWEVVPSQVLESMQRKKYSVQTFQTRFRPEDSQLLAQ